MSDVKKFLDEEGVKYLWDKINMNDYPNNTILVAVLDAIDETKADKSDLETKIDKSEIEEMDAIEIAVDMGLVEPTSAEDGSIYTDENGNIYSL